MTRLSWNPPVNDRYEAGVSHGVLYFPDVSKGFIDLNGGFDENRLGWTAGWVSNPAWGFYTESDLEWDPTFGRKKPGSLKVTFNGGSTIANFVYLLKDFVPVGTTLRLRGWIYTPAGVTANPKAEALFNGPGNKGPVVLASWNSWTFVDWVFETKSLDAYAGFSWEGTTPGQSVWIDDVSLEIIERSPGISWNGLTSVEETAVGGERDQFYFDGVKYFDMVGIRHFRAVVRSFSIPTEFGPCLGNVEHRPGFVLTRQPKVSFGFSYRTKVGEYDYKTHLVYNAVASSNGRAYETISDSPTPSEFEMTVDAVPSRSTWYKPTAHLIIDSRKTSVGKLSAIENALYGTNSTDPILPSQYELNNIVGNLLSEPISEPI